MNPKHTLKEYADALTRAGLLTATTLTPAAENAVIDCLSYDTRSLHGTSLFLCKGAHFKAEYLSAALAQGAVARCIDPATPEYDARWDKQKAALLERMKRKQERNIKE